jgi:hypothetical protein
MQVWFLAGRGLKKSGAYGYISHNDVWAADSTAHWNGRTYGQDVGWVIQKARDMIPYMYQAWGALGLVWDDPSHPLYADHYKICEDICHNIIELAGDIVLKRHAPLIGAKVTAAAALRAPEFQDLLVQAMGSCKPEPYIRGWEQGFRDMMIMYGFGLQQSEEEAIAAFAGQLADISTGYLVSLGLPNPGYDAVYALALGGMYVALDLIQYDYMREVHATIKMVRWQMLRHWVFYWR